MTYHDEVRHAECGTPMGNWYWVGHLTYWDGARHAMPVRHAEKQLVSKIAGEKKSPDTVSSIRAIGLVVFQLSIYFSCQLFKPCS